jgi:DNA-binding CsgD family transcriptional regulator
MTRAYRPRNPMRHAQLVALVRAGKTHRQIASIYGGTRHGVRSNLRRLRELGAL